jgi:hypothetical protein
VDAQPFQTAEATDTGRWFMIADSHLIETRRLLVASVTVTIQ